MPIPAPLRKRQTGYRLPQGEWFNDIIERVNSLFDGSLSGSANTAQVVAAAGSNSQTNASLITKALVMVTTVSATTRAVKLPAAATGLTVQIHNATTTNVKVYPNTGDRIGAAATNAVGAAIAGNKANIYVAQNASTWRVLTGA